MIRGGTDVIIIEIKFIINVMCLNNPQIITQPPNPWSLEKLSSLKSVPGAKKAGDCCELSFIKYSLTLYHILTLYNLLTTFSFLLPLSIRIQEGRDFLSAFLNLFSLIHPNTVELCSINIC